MQLTSTIITLLSAASLTLAAPTSDSTYKPKYTPSSNIQYSNGHGNTYRPNKAGAQPPVLNAPAQSQVEVEASAKFQARLQLELERQTTFIQREVPVPGRIPLKVDTLFSAFIVSVEYIDTGEKVKDPITCQGLDAQGRAVGAAIGADSGEADLNGGEAVQIAFIECLGEQEASSSS